MKSSATYSLKKQHKQRTLYFTALLFLLTAVLCGLFLGGTRLRLAELLGGASSAAGRIFLYVRLPRTLASLLCGAALSVSGAVIQCVLANRLASPGVIGVNAGAGLAVTLCAALGIYGGWPLSLASFAGAFAAVALISFGARKWGASRGTVILMGVALNSLLGAVSDTVITFVPEVSVMSSHFRIGAFSAVTLPELIPGGCLILTAIVMLLSFSNDLDILTLGEESAAGLGMVTGRMRTLFLLLAALLAGCAVSLAGLLSFVGLMVPHAVRRAAGSGGRSLLGLCALFGAAFVSLCDTAARTLFAPYELPVGILMAFFGAPFFVLLLIRGKGGHGHA